MDVSTANKGATMKYTMLALMCIPLLSHAVTTKDIMKMTHNTMSKNTAANVVNAINCGKRYNKQSPGIVMVADMSLSSYQKRFWALDMKNNTLVVNDYVAHGRGSDPERKGMATVFSDEPNSMQTSLGLYRVGEEYHSDKMKKEARKLDGLMIGWNANARIRGVVFHPAQYVSSGYVGRSEGCPAVRSDVYDTLDATNLDGALLWIDGPDKALGEDVAACAASAKSMHYIKPVDPSEYVGKVCTPPIAVTEFSNSLNRAWG